MSAIVGSNRVTKTTRNESKRPPLGHAGLIKYHISNLANRILVTDDADRNFLIPLELKAEFTAWVEHDFTGNEDRFDNYRLPDC
jgi:hypothetical protein